MVERGGLEIRHPPSQGVPERPISYLGGPSSPLQYCLVTPLLTDLVSRMLATTERLSISKRIRSRRPASAGLSEPWRRTVTYGAAVHAPAVQAHNAYGSQVGRTSHGARDLQTAGGVLESCPCQNLDTKRVLGGPVTGGRMFPSFQSWPGCVLPSPAAAPPCSRPRPGRAAHPEHRA